MQQHSAKQDEASNENTILRRKKLCMSIIFNHLYIRSTGLCDLKTLYYQTGQSSKRFDVSVLKSYAKYKVYVV